MASSSATELNPEPAAMQFPNIGSATTVKDLRSNSIVWYKIHALIYDLRKYGESYESQEQFDTITDASYIDLPYFEPNEGLQLKNTLLNGNKTLETVIEETLKERLERRQRKRDESGDFRVCAAHDPAPIFEKAFDVKPKDLAKDKEFLRIIGQHRLTWNDSSQWKGLSKKPFQKKTKHKKH